MTPLAPEDIETNRFPTRAFGYDRETVDAYLQRVADAYREALERRPTFESYRELGEEFGDFLQHAKDAADALELQADEKLKAARRSADTTVERAREEATRLKRDAARAAEEIRARAESDAETARAEAEKLKSRARSYVTVVQREAKREAIGIREGALREAREIRAAAHRDASLQTERSERRVRHLESLELALANRVSAAEEKLQSLSDNGSESA
jgi:DivIVA domain-containing protein